MLLVGLCSVGCGPTSKTSPTPATHKEPTGRIPMDTHKTPDVSKTPDTAIKPRMDTGKAADTSKALDTGKAKTPATDTKSKDTSKATQKSP